MEAFEKLLEAKEKAREKAIAITRKLEGRLKEIRLGCVMSIEYARNEGEVAECLDQMREKIRSCCTERKETVQQHVDEFARTVRLSRVPRKAGYHSIEDPREPSRT